jgi:hypothetical protein
MKQKPMDGKIKRAIAKVFAEPVTKYVTIITLIISFLLIVQAWVDGTQRDGHFLSAGDKLFALSFVEWFGVVYGFLLPTILVRVWEQFDEIDNVLDREADAVKSLVGDLLLLDEQYEDFRDHVLDSLLRYSENVIEFVNKKISDIQEKESGEKILKDIRGYYIEIFRTRDGETQANDILKDELLNQLNNVIDNRGDRISLSNQRLFESLNLIAVVTSILWLVPFYFLYFQNPITGEELHLGFFGWLLVIFVTFLIIMILSIIEDLDKPFDGYWMVNIKSWEDLVVDIKNEYKNKKLQRTEDIAQKTPPTQGEGVPSRPETKSSLASVPQIPNPPPVTQEAQPTATAEEKQIPPVSEKNTNHTWRKLDPLTRLLAVKYLLFGFPKGDRGK